MEEQMSVFKDSDGTEWRIMFDAFSLDDVRKETEIDLADIASGGWLKVETDSGAVGRVMAVLCRDEIAARKIDALSFVRTLRGDAITEARAALVAEGADFFPQSEWSAIQSNLEKRKEAKTQAEMMQHAMAAMDGMTPEFREGAMVALMDVVKTSAVDNITLSSSLGKGSAAGQDVTPLNVATSEPEKSESQPVG